MRQIRQRTFNCKTDKSATTVPGSLPPAPEGGKLLHCVFLFRFPLQLLPHRLHVCCTKGACGTRGGGRIPRRGSLLLSAAINKSVAAGEASPLRKVLAAAALCLSLSFSVHHVASVCGIVFNLSKLKSATNRRTTTCNLPPKMDAQDARLVADEADKRTRQRGRDRKRETDRDRQADNNLADSRQQTSQGRSDQGAWLPLGQA